MPRFLIQVPHREEYFACEKALRSIKERGSHFVTQAHWGCRDGVHVGWLMVEMDDRRQALHVVPPELRADALVVQLNRWTREEISARLRSLREAGGDSGTVTNGAYLLPVEVGVVRPGPLQRTAW